MPEAVSKNNPPLSCGTTHVFRVVKASLEEG